MTEVITATEFEVRLATLCQRGAGSTFPRRPRDRHILYRSVVQALGAGKTYSETTLSAALQQWLSEVGAGIDVDHVSLRRYLVDDGYLSRDAEGSTYSVNLNGGGHVEFDEAVGTIDSFAVIQAAKVRAAARKREQAERSREGRHDRH